MPAVLEDLDFIRIFHEGGAKKVVEASGVTERQAYQRRVSLEKKYGIQIKGPGFRPQSTTRHAEDHAAVVERKVRDGVVLVGSDAHIWPHQPRTTAMRAFVKFCKELEPKLVILNGDALDFPQVSRHAPIGHADLPKVEEEIEAAQEQLHDIELAVARSCDLIWTLGNHDGRFETRLATHSPEYARLKGHSLKDHFPAWTACWRCDINDDVVVKHRYKGGIHATHNNTLWAGKTTVTGHLHSAKVTPFNDYNGIRFGVDTGCLADPGAKAFIDYTECNPLNWRSGFAVLTFVGGALLQPELVLVHSEDTVQFRGEIIAI
jgi:hypothetical protein